MILKALYNYYNRNENLAPEGAEYKEIAFLLVIRTDGTFVRIEDTRDERGVGTTMLVAKSWARTGITPQPFHLWDNFSYVCGISESTIKLEKEEKPDKEKLTKFHKEIEKNIRVHKGFVDYAMTLKQKYPENKTISAIVSFYEKNDSCLLDLLKNDVSWNSLSKALTKNLSFLIEGETEAVAAKKEILKMVPSSKEDTKKADSVCLVSGAKCSPVLTFSKIKIGKFADTKLISFQTDSGYDSYGKEQGANAPISEDAEFKIASSLRHLLKFGSRNKFDLTNRSFVFWSSNNNEIGLKVEESLFDFLGYQEDQNDPNAKIEKVRAVFKGVYSGSIKTGLEDKFYILGLYPANKARLAVAYWQEITLRDFAARILKHFDDMQIVDGRKERKPYYGLSEILSAITIDGKVAEATPNLSEAVVRSIFEGIPYPYTLYASCISRIKAEVCATEKKNKNYFENKLCTRIAILKAYLNRLNDNNQTIRIMLDKENTNKGYLCGRLFAILDRIQEKANNQHSIQERYMNAASATPAAVFATILNLSNHHAEKLEPGIRIYFEKLKQEIMTGLTADGFPTHLDLQDQGRFFIGFYHQRQDFFAVKQDELVTE